MTSDKDGRTVRGAGRSQYSSPLRAERAAETKRRIAIAALELFSESGFARTTVARIAERAGVAVPTVYAVYNSKAAIVGTLLAQLEEDADSAGWRARIADERDPRRKLAGFAEWSAAFFSSSRPVVVAARGAAGDPAIVQLQEQGNAHRREALHALLTSIGPDLRSDLPLEAAVDRAWILTGLELYLAATEACGWSDAAYTTWLTALLHDQLLDPELAPSRSKRPVPPARLSVSQAHR